MNKDAVVKLMEHNLVRAKTLKERTDSKYYNGYVVATSYFLQFVRQITCQHQPSSSSESSDSLSSSESYSTGEPAMNSTVLETLKAIRQELETKRRNLLTEVSQIQHRIDGLDSAIESINHHIYKAEKNAG